MGVRMSVKHLMITTSCLLFACSGAVADHELPFGNDEACMEGPLAQFGRYIGDWNIEDSSLAQDGSAWQEGQGARWIFSCLGNGTGIQDFWLPTNGNVGTNLRTYNAETGKWDIVWAINATPGLTHIEAEQDAGGNIVMNYIAPIPSPLRRITFFSPDDEGWSWQLEYSNDGGETWFAVYKIRATPLG